MKKRHYILISSFVVIPLISQLILIKTKKTSALHSQLDITHASSQKKPLAHSQHIVAELINCRTLDNDLTLKNILEDALDTLDPPLHWNTSQIKSAGNYVVALLDDFYCAVHITPEKSLYVDLYADNCMVDLTYIIASLEKECVPTKTKQLIVNLAT